MLQMSSSSDYDRQKNNNNSGGRSSRNKKKGAPFMFFSNILRKKKILGFDEIREMNTRTRSEPSGKGVDDTQRVLKWSDIDVRHSEQERYSVL